MGVLGLPLAPVSALGDRKTWSEQGKPLTTMGAGSLHKHVRQLEKRKKCFAGSCGVGVEREAVGSSCCSCFGSLGGINSFRITQAEGYSIS